ncbi:MAG TPA: Holliday junction resolvase RuvX [Pseudogracilibacillus sp.]|nr:Holliday junction resolvase RuvX [Pseudogracilibacillus sp.]
MRTLGLDVGSKTIGVAISDPFQVTAQTLKTIYWDENDMSSADAALDDIIKDYEITKIVVGLPKNMDGSIGERAKITEIYANRIARQFNIHVELFDERLSTMSAERTLLEADVSRKKRGKVIDQVAATIILQNYLDMKQ